MHLHYWHHVTLYESVDRINVTFSGTSGTVCEHGNKLSGSKILGISLSIRLY
jgi:hypothetical protein